MAAPLSPETEHAILERIAAGEEAKSIAAHFHIATSTVYRTAYRYIGEFDRRATVIALARGLEHNPFVAAQHAFEGYIRDKRSSSHGHRNLGR